MVHEPSEKALGTMFCCAAFETKLRVYTVFRSCESFFFFFTCSAFSRLFLH